MEKVQCQGVEASLSQCPARLSNRNADAPCRGGMHAVVRCVAGSQFTQNGRAPAPPAVPVSGTQTFIHISRRRGLNAQIIASAGPRIWDLTQCSVCFLAGSAPEGGASARGGSR